ncbi:MAG: 4Fe-4S dicluster domain-containing protein [Lachnospiraceae bacterium]|nr:4Fe-4S dicluster domain-containing protein [Lachnospiraceae bacterium]
MSKTISKQKVPARTGGMCASCGVCSSYCPAQIDIPAVIKIYREYLAGDTQTLKKLDEMESVGTPVDCIECGACSARCACGVDAAGIVRELAMMQSCRRTLMVSCGRKEVGI